MTDTTTEPTPPPSPPTSEVRQGPAVPRLPFPSTIKDMKALQHNA